MQRFVGHSEYVYRKRQRENRRIGWVSYFISKHGDNPSCQICGKELVWYGFSDEINKVVHFDHANKADPINVPSLWVEGHACNSKNISIWERYNFGILCQNCNTSLPTENREKWIQKASIETEWLEKVIKYVKEHK